MSRDDRINDIKCGIGVGKDPTAEWFDSQSRDIVKVEDKPKRKIIELDLNGLRTFLENVHKAKSFVDPEVYAKKEIKNREKELVWVKENVLIQVRSSAQIEAPLLGCSYKASTPFMQPSGFEEVTNEDLQLVHKDLVKLETEVKDRIKLLELKDAKEKEIEKEDAEEYFIYEDNLHYEVVEEVRPQVSPKKKEKKKSVHIIKESKTKYVPQEHHEESKIKYEPPKPQAKSFMDRLKDLFR